MKKLRNVAISPDLENQQNTEWLEQEYLGLYSRIVSHHFTGQAEEEWIVWDHHKNEYVSLEDWLAHSN